MTDTNNTTDTLQAEIDAIIAVATGGTNPVPMLEATTESTDQAIVESISPPVDQVTSDVEAILAEIAAGGNQTPAPAVTEKPARKSRTKKSPDTSAATPPPVDVATGAEPSPSAPAPVATDPAAFKALMTAADSAAYDERFGAAAQKVKEKAQNAVSALTGGKKLSRFTSMAVKTLVAKRTVTSNDLIQVYTDAGLGMGTARAQSQQMTSLFRMFGLVAQEGRSFTLANEELGKQLASVA